MLRVRGEWGGEPTEQLASDWLPALRTDVGETGSRGKRSGTYHAHHGAAPLRFTMALRATMHYVIFIGHCRGRPADLAAYKNDVIYVLSYLGPS